MHFCYREILAADACTVILNKWNPHYYEVGMYLKKFNNRDCEMMMDSLLLVSNCPITFDRLGIIISVRVIPRHFERDSG